VTTLLNGGDERGVVGAGSPTCGHCDNEDDVAACEVEVDVDGESLDKNWWFLSGGRLGQ
jgi:hypothetical protein